MSRASWCYESLEGLLHSENFDGEGRVWVVGWLACRMRGRFTEVASGRTIDGDGAESLGGQACRTEQVVGNGRYLPKNTICDQSRGSPSRWKSAVEFKLQYAIWTGAT